MVVTIHFKRKKIIFDPLMIGNYDGYLESDEWKARRATARDNVNGECQLCFKAIGNKGVLHHINYDNLFNENENDCIYICWDCNRDRHG